MKEPDKKDLDKALEMSRAGKSLKEILEVTGLNYSQAWLYIEDAELPAGERVKSKDATALKVKELRDGGMSWGKISVRFGYRAFPEGKIRKMYAEATGLMSQGQRIGKGGRYLDGDPILYRDERQKVGIALKVGTNRTKVREISASLQGKAPSLATKKAAAKAGGAVKSGAAKKTTKKVAKKVAAKPVVEEPEVDPFE